MIRVTNVLIAPLVVGLSLSVLFAQSNNKPIASDRGGNTITGRVVAQGRALPGVKITLWHGGFVEPTEQHVTAKGQTDVHGNYELRQVPPGNYFIAATATGFVTGKENQIIANLRHVVVTGSGSIDPINFELVREGVIKGTVTDADGKPVTRTPITIFPESFPADVVLPPYARNISTDVQGMYRVSGMPAGRYRIAAGYYPLLAATYFGRDGYRRTFYPAAADEAHASVIEIAPGSEITDANINMGRSVKTFSVSARIIDSQNGKPIGDIDCGLEVFSNGKRIGGVILSKNRSNSPGEITIDNVPPGEYVIRVPSGKSSYVVSEGPPVGPNIFGQSRHFEVTDKDVAEVEILVVRAATVSGFVSIEGPAGMDVLARVPQMHLVAIVEPKPGSSSSPIVEAKIKADGSFVFVGLKPGKLRLSFLPPSVGGRLPLNFVRTEREGVKLDHEAEIESGDEITGLRLVLAYAHSSIHGVVKLDDGTVPTDLVAGIAVLQHQKMIGGGGSLDPHGNFLLEHLHAGEYTLRVIAHDADRRNWTVEQQITVVDDRVSEATIVLDSKVKPTPRPVVPR
jgi:hypothetical protein